MISGTLWNRSYFTNQNKKSTTFFLIIAKSVIDITFLIMLADKIFFHNQKAFSNGLKTKKSLSRSKCVKVIKIFLIHS